MDGCVGEYQLAGRHRAWSRCWYVWLSASTVWLPWATVFQLLHRLATGTLGQRRAVGAHYQRDVRVLRHRQTERFQQQVQKYPNHVAIKTNAQTATYSELNQAANQIGRALLAHAAWRLRRAVE